MCVAHFKRSSADEHLGCFQLLFIMNRAVVNTHLQSLCINMCSFLLHMYLHVKWVENRVSMC